METSEIGIASEIIIIMHQLSNTKTESKLNGKRLPIISSLRYGNFTSAPSVELTVWLNEHCQYTLSNARANKCYTNTCARSHTHTHTKNKLNNISQTLEHHESNAVSLCLYVEMEIKRIHVRFTLKFGHLESVDSAAIRANIVKLTNFDVINSHTYVCKISISICY